MRRFRRRPIRRRRSFRRKRTFRRSRRSANKIHIRAIKQRYVTVDSTQTGQTDGIVDVPLEQDFELDTYNQVNDFIQQFQWIKFNKLVFRLEPTRNVNTSWGTTIAPGINSVHIPTVHWCRDYNDIEPFPDTSVGLDYIQSRDSYRTHLLATPLTIKFTPNYLMPVFMAGGVSQGTTTPALMTNTPVFNKWVDTGSLIGQAQPLIYMGVRAMIVFPADVNGNHTYWTYRLVAKAYVSFKGIRRVGDVT